ncbi:DUF2997 domain-containing protein [Streptomyces sp. NPDC051940]|uniref:DUF2997 domain-containing protein n=1 Tax=Streptomyces sp. NPDC051940 TaxID=3155675 RepID=UPI0034477221
MEQSVEIVIDGDGKVTLRVAGVEGTECLALTEPFEQLLGADVEHREMTPEADQALYGTDHVEQRRGG